MSKAVKRGRPAATKVARTEHAFVRLTPPEKDAWEGAAASAERNLSDWIRVTCNRAAGVKP